MTTKKVINLDEYKRRHSMIEGDPDEDVEVIEKYIIWMKEAIADMKRRNKEMDRRAILWRRAMFKLIKERGLDDIYWGRKD